jgi:hypothetical protein
MRIYETREELPKQDAVMIRTYLERVMYATPNEDIRGWIKGKLYAVIVNKMSCGKFCIYKEFGNSNLLLLDIDVAPDDDYKDSGYKVYNTLEEIEAAFSCRKHTKEISRREEKVQKQGVKFNVN